MRFLTLESNRSDDAFFILDSIKKEKALCLLVGAILKVNQLPQKGKLCARDRINFETCGGVLHPGPHWLQA